MQDEVPSLMSAGILAATAVPRASPAGSWPHSPQKNRMRGIVWDFLFQSKTSHPGKGSPGFLLFESLFQGGEGMRSRPWPVLSSLLCVIPECRRECVMEYLNLQERSFSSTVFTRKPILGTPARALVRHRAWHVSCGAPAVMAPSQEHQKWEPGQSQRKMGH